jgi:hypothetical protein
MTLRLTDLRLNVIVTRVPEHMDYGTQQLVGSYYEAQVASGLPTWWDEGELAVAGTTARRAVEGLRGLLHRAGLSGTMRVLYPPRGLGIGRRP